MRYQQIVGITPGKSVCTPREGGTARNAPRRFPIIQAGISMLTFLEKTKFVLKVWT